MCPLSVSLAASPRFVLFVFAGVRQDYHTQSAAAQRVRASSQPTGRTDPASLAEGCRDWQATGAHEVLMVGAHEVSLMVGAHEVSLMAGRHTGADPLVAAASDGQTALLS